MKRGLDVFVSAAGLLMLSPVFGVIAAVIRLSDGGPVFYRGTRVGRFGTYFAMHKFRTMVVNADQLGGPCTAADDPRITRIGRMLRRYKLDELPQLLDVLAGTMSLVGPRPEVPAYVANYTTDQRRLLDVRPGITDRASIRLRNEEELYRGVEDPEAIYRAFTQPEKIRLGLEYVGNHSFFGDLSILLATMRAMFEVRGVPSYVTKELIKSGSQSTEA